MKIIVAGYAKTGTKSLNVALTRLGYNVYDFIEHLWFHGDDWIKIFEEGKGTVEDFKRMYKNVDVILDAPVYVFWEEIHQAFPDAMIIFTTRDEDSFFKSSMSQLAEYNNSWFLQLAMAITPTGWKYFHHMKIIGPMSWGCNFIKPCKEVKANEMLSRRLYRQHCAYVLENAPKDKLLVYSIKKGWKPLCEFLGKEIPDEPFPHENIGGKAIEKFIETHPVMQRLKKELLVSSSLIFSLVFFGGYKLWQTGLFRKAGGWLASLIAAQTRTCKSGCL